MLLSEIDDAGWMKGVKTMRDMIHRQGKHQIIVAMLKCFLVLQRQFYFVIVGI